MTLLMHTTRRLRTPQNTLDTLCTLGKDSPAGLQEVGGMLVANSQVALFYLEVENFYAFASLFGEELAQQMLASAEEVLQQLSRTTMHHCRSRHVVRLAEGQFMVLCGPSCQEPEELMDLAQGLRYQLKAQLRAQAVAATGQDLDVLAGVSLLSNYGDKGPEAVLYSGLCDAQRMARTIQAGDESSDQKDLGLRGEFRRIMETPHITAHYQPIVDLATGEIAAWEALSRGPQGSFFQSPAVLFDYAEDAGQLFRLEQVCREIAIRNFGEAGPKQLLFLNIHPRTLVDLNFSAGNTMRIIQESGLNPQNVVFEITERHAIREFSLFHKTLDHYRGQGYRVAVDDVGAGYSGLMSIAEIRPDFIKIDMSIVRDVDSNPVKRALLETFVAFSEKIGCKIIAEGIETPTELSSLMHMGAHFGQGYYLARPAFPKPETCLTLPSWTRLGAGRESRATEVKCSIPVGELQESANAVAPETRVCEIKDLINSPEPINAVAVARNDRPVGLVMSHHIDRALSSRYGMSLYYHRRVERVMDPAPLIVEADTPVESVARRAMGREKSKIYDHILVTEKGMLSGMVSVQRMLDTLATVQVEMAKGANPLTGLPGNVAIEQEVSIRSQQGEPYAIIYADLDNFKVYNDVYGFKSGDEIILLLAKIMTWAARKRGDREPFVGHVGGDDFVCISDPESCERICMAITRVFGRLARHGYSKADRERGYITGLDRHGYERRFPLVSVSLAIVDCQGGARMADIAKRSAEMKKYAKSISGNSYVRDRREHLVKAV